MSRFLDDKLAKLVPYTPGEQPKNMSELIKLNTNENPYPPSPKVIAAINGAEVSGLNLYSDPDCTALIESIARYHGLESFNVFPGNGSDEVLAFCFYGLCQNGAAFPDITYGFYKVYAQMFGVNAEIIPLKDDFTIDVADYANAKGTVFIANPNAPTSIFLPVAEIETLLRQSPDRLVVVDEAYVEFGGESAQCLLGEYENLLIIHTFSKSHSLAGARLGYALGVPELIADLNTLKFSFNPYNINRLSITAGAAAMDDLAYLDETRRKIIETREFVAGELRNLGFNIPESRANFLFVGGHPKISGERYFSTLRENGILVRHFSEPRIKEYVRMSIGTREQMETTVALTKKILEAENDS